MSTVASQQLDAEYVLSSFCQSCIVPSCSQLCFPLALRFASSFCSFAIKPETLTPALNTKDWPLLLKNYDKLLVRSA